MSRSDATLAWSVLLRPVVGDPGELPPLPAFVTRLAPSAGLPSVDPIQRVLHGLLGTVALARGPAGPNLQVVVSGLGDLLGVTIVARRPGDVEGHPPHGELRGAALAAASAEGLPGLQSELAAEGRWEFAGLAEVQGVLSEGLQDELPEDLPALRRGSITLIRGTGVGEGHAAWTAEAAYARASQRAVAAQALKVLCEGHEARPPALVAFAAQALRWGQAASRAARKATALEGLGDEVRAAASWAVAGGPWPGGGEPELPRLAARLEILRVGLQDEVSNLQAQGHGARRAARRLLGGVDAQPGGPLDEASSLADEVVQRLEARVAAAARHADALAVAMRAG